MTDFALFHSTLIHSFIAIVHPSFSFISLTKLRDLAMESDLCISAMRHPDSVPSNFDS